MFAVGRVDTAGGQPAAEVGTCTWLALTSLHGQAPPGHKFAEHRQRQRRN